MRYLLLCLASALPAATASAAGLTIEPSSVAADYSGTLTLNITGLATGQTVLVQTFLDANGNGAIDSGEPLVQSFTVTDGLALSIGGVRNSNVPGDEDGAGNTEIRTVLKFPALAEANQVVAKFVYQVSPATSGFTPVTAPFTITQPVFGQKVVGRVTSGGSAVAYAYTFLADPSLNGGPMVVALADADGNFTLNAAPGSYAVVALKPGFVSEFSAPAVVTVNTGATVTQNLSLAAADRTISGRVTDVDSGVGIAGVQITAQSQSGLFALVFSDANGHFVIPVSSASTEWGVNPSNRPLALSGYVSLDDDYAVDISSGDVPGVSIQLPKATALIYGTLRDNQGDPLAGVSLYAYGGGPYDGYGVTDSSGAYVAGVIGGTWSIGPDSSELAPLGYLAQSATVSTSAGQATAQDLVAQKVTAHLIGRVTDDSGNPVQGIHVAVFGAGDRHSVETDSDGSFSLGVFAGTWGLALDAQDAAQRGLVGPTTKTLIVQDGVDITNIAIVVRHATAQVNGWVRNGDGTPVSGVGINALFVEFTGSFDAYQKTDSGGNFSLSVFEATWQVYPNCDDLQSRGYTCPASQFVTITSGVKFAFAYFTVQRVGAMTPTPPPTATPTPTPRQIPGGCVGDCDGSGDVTVNELIAMVNIALGNAPLSSCTAGDADASGGITINEIIAAVGNTLNGCPS